MRFVAFLLAALVLSSPCLAADPPGGGGSQSQRPDPYISFKSVTYLGIFTSMGHQQHIFNCELNYSSKDTVAADNPICFVLDATGGPGEPVPANSSGTVTITFNVPVSLWDGQSTYTLNCRIVTAGTGPPTGFCIDGNPYIYDPNNLEF